jgi:hypothetical protein
MSLIHDLIERTQGWERLRGRNIPQVARLKYTTEPNYKDEHLGINYYFGNGEYFVKDDKYEYKIHKEVFAPNQATRIPRAWTYRRKL